MAETDVSPEEVVDVLSTPNIIATASILLVGKPVPTKVTSVGESIVTDVTVGESAFNYSNLHSS